MTEKKRFSISVPDDLISDIEQIAESKGKQRADIIIEACKLYRDYNYMATKASLLSENILRSMQATVSGMEERLNNKSNQLLSTMAIELYILEHILARELDIEPDDVIQYRRDAIEVLRRNNRIFRMDETLP